MQLLSFSHLQCFSVLLALTMILIGFNAWTSFYFIVLHQISLSGVSFGGDGHVIEPRHVFRRGYSNRLYFFPESCTKEWGSDINDLQILNHDKYAICTFGC